MSLSERISQLVKVTVCRTCAFYEALPPKDRTAFDEWIVDGRSVEELRRICTEEGLAVSGSPFRSHIREHHGKR